MKIKILNWHIYNPRKDYKRPWWFAMSNRFLEDQDLFDLSNDEKIAFIYFLCQASQKNSAEIIINFDHARRFGNLKKSDILSAIEKLQSIQIIEHIRTESVQEPYGICTPQYNIIQYNTNIAQKNLRASNFEDEDKNSKKNDIYALDQDLEKIYALYPKKVGKADGFEVLRKTLKPEDLVFFERAVRNYAKECENQKTEQKFIKQFSTFVGPVKIQRWRDWVDRVPEVKRNRFIP